MAEWSIAAVLKTVVLRGTGGSNPSLSADKWIYKTYIHFLYEHYPSYIVVLRKEQQ